ncbi:MAG TPA: DNA-formamidopyrimidine glycosylase family protein [Anaerolineae bacterium]|nr:DNA-formamidopyrimidine glycosylase family protein [Anaerolineae bacterium]
MPELPELEVVCEVLQRRVVNQRIAAVEVGSGGGAIVVRDLTHHGFAPTSAGAKIAEVARRGKFLLFPVSPGWGRNRSPSRSTNLENDCDLSVARSKAS